MLNTMSISAEDEFDHGFVTSSAADGSIFFGSYLQFSSPSSSQKKQENETDGKSFITFPVCLWVSLQIQPPCYSTHQLLTIQVHALVYCTLSGGSRGGRIGRGPPFFGRLVHYLSGKFMRGLFGFPCPPFSQILDPASADTYSALWDIKAHNKLQGTRKDYFETSIKIVQGCKTIKYRRELIFSIQFKWFLFP